MSKARSTMALFFSDDRFFFFSLFLSDTSSAMAEEHSCNYYKLLSDFTLALLPFDILK